MSATYVALQGEDTDDNKHPDPVTAPAAGPPAAIAITITTPITPRRITRRPITNRGNPASPPRSLGAARRRARSSWGARTPSCGSRAKCADAFAPHDDDDDTRSSSDDATKKACDAAAAAMEMPCVDEPAGAMRALEAGAMSAETAARTLGESAVSCADAAAAAETACAL